MYSLEDERPTRLYLGFEYQVLLLNHHFKFHIYVYVNMNVKPYLECDDNFGISW